VKWPNDIFFGEQKLGGILIENTLSGPKIQSSIAGIGLNINQREFEVPTATSLAGLTGRQYVLPALVTRLLECLEKRYLQLRAGQVASLHQAYLRVLYRYQEPRLFEVNGRIITGQIMGVDEAGQLLVVIDGQQRHFGLQQIKYLPSAI
jgi:BirA family biotin operon repressor/biotin-[acetyl-CoA-carboxylase] ligase